MATPEHSIFSISEKTVTGQSLLTNAENNRIRIDSQPVDDGVMYMVTGRIPMGRTAIADLISAPLGSIGHSWQEVRKGLSAVSYPSSFIKGLQLGRDARGQLNAVRPASKELANILLRNQPYNTESRNIPVFNWKTAYIYALQQLLYNTNSHKLVEQLEGLVTDKAAIGRLRSFIDRPQLAMEKELKQLTQITGIDENEQHLIENSVLLTETDVRVIVELIHRSVDDTFTSFRDEVEYHDGVLRGGSFEESVHLRKDDVPEYLMGNSGDVRVEVGGVLRDRESLPWERRKDRADKTKTTGLERRQVTFVSRSPEFTAYPRLVWVNRQGKRELAFPISQSETSLLNPAVSRPSSLAGAALAANFFGALKGIHYDEKLQKVLWQRHHRSYRLRERYRPMVAGLLPLVIHHRQDELLNDPYFASIEDAVDA